MIMLQLLFTYLPFMNRVFHTLPIGWVSWGAVMVVAVLAVLLVEVEKRLGGYWASGPHGSDRSSRLKGDGSC
jgi:hypothetical protein